MLRRGWVSRRFTMGAPSETDMNRLRYALLFAAAAAFAQVQVEVARVVSRPVERTIRLPGEFLPYESVEIRARVPGYVDRVLVDRGSVVHKGDLLVALSAPEMKAQIAEAQ